MAEATNNLIKLLLILFVFDIIRKFYFKPKDINKGHINKNKILTDTDNSIINSNSKLDLSQNDKYDDDEFASKKITDNEENYEENENQKNNIKILIINYDKYLYEKRFIKIKDEIENNFTNIFVEGKEYPIPETKKLFSKFTYITQIGVSLLIIFTKYLKLGLPFLSDNSIHIIEEYKWFIIIGNFLLHYWLNKYIGTTGAFEIIYNNKTLYSKLEKHIFPKKVDIDKIIKILRIKPREEEDF